MQNWLVTKNFIKRSNARCGKHIGGKMTPENEVEQVITRSLSAAEIMDLTGHNKWTLFPILHRLIRENKITKKNLRYAPTGYSDKLISNKQDQFFCADPFGLSGLRDNRDLQSRLRAMQTKNFATGTMQGLTAADGRKLRWA
jgi:hypothetical protein